MSLCKGLNDCDCRRLFIVQKTADKGRCNSRQKRQDELHRALGYARIFVGYGQMRNYIREVGAEEEIVGARKSDLGEQEGEGCRP